MGRRICSAGKRLGLDTVRDAGSAGMGMDGDLTF